MAKEKQVQRPIKKTEYVIIFASRQSELGWRDLCATQRNVMVETWDFLTRTPQQETATNYPLKGRYEKLTRDGFSHTRWQHKPTLKGSARIWFYVEGQKVYLEDVHTHHPNETKR